MRESLPLIAVSGLVLFLWLIHLILWKIMGFNVLLFSPIQLPSIETISENLKWVLSGRSNGTTLYLHGFFIFGVINAFFLSTGKRLFNFIFRKSQTFPDLPITERVSIHYLLGSLLASLIWLGIGSSGFLNLYAAAGMGLVGCALFTKDIFGFKRPFRLTPRLISEKLTGTLRQMTTAEKTMVFLLGFILILWSAVSIKPQEFSDTLLTHISLPQLFIGEGRVFTYPYHLYSYFPMNTEMLVTWALLFKSEVAASLLMWGFLVSFVLLMWGFLKRYTSDLVALTAVFIFLSAPIIAGYSTAIKSDFPVSLFIFAHYLAMVEALNRQENNRDSSAGWILLAGIFCGGAVGHKLNALFTVLFTSCLILGIDWFYRNKQRPYRFLSPFWFLGLAITITPWFFRTFLATGNPIYPFLNELLMKETAQSWHMTSRAMIGATQSPGLSSSNETIINFFRSIMGLNLYHRGIRMLTPEWGPTFLFGLLALFSFRKKFQPGFRLCLGIALITWIALLNVALRENYHIGFFAFLICIPFALHFNLALRSNYSKPLKIALLTLVAFCFHKTFLQSSFWIAISTSLNRAAAGYLPGNYKTADQDMDHLRWISYLLNTRTADHENILYAGVYYAYGPARRKVFFSSSVDKQMIAAIAEQSPTGLDLKNNLRDQGIKHIIIDASSLNTFTKPVWKNMMISKENLEKIEGMIEEHMVLRYKTPKENIQWYSFKDGTVILPITLNEDDIRNHPVRSMEFGDAHFKAGRLDQAERLSNLALKTPMLDTNRAGALWLSGSVLLVRGEKEKAEKRFLDAIRLAPDNAEIHFKLANIYRKIQETDKAVIYYQKAIRLDTNAPEPYQKLADLYYDQENYEKASQLYERVTEIEPENADAHLSLGAAYYEAKDYAQSVQSYQKAIDLDPDLFEAYNNLGSIFYERKEYDKAFPLYLQAVRKNPRSAAGHYNLGNVYSEQKEFRKALDQYKTALKLSPDNETFQKRVTITKQLIP